jgi:tetratricopeptide (TPR) repeat protein
MLGSDSGGRMWGRIASYIFLSVGVAAAQSNQISPQRAAGNNLVSVQDLNTSPKLTKELARVTQLMEQQEWTDALSRVRKLLDKHPSYAQGYNSLALVYSHFGNLSQAQEALQQAIRLDDRFTIAYRNLARVNILQNNWLAAESRLSKAAALEPDDVVTWNLLAYAQMKNNDLDEALKTIARVHAAKLEHHGFVHIVAAYVYQKKDQVDNLIAELRTYLSEEPTGSDADAVRSSLAKVNVSVTELPAVTAMRP